MRKYVLLVAVIIACAAILVLAPPGLLREQKDELRPPFLPAHGTRFAADVRPLASAIPGFPEVLEDGRKLRSTLADVAEDAAGERRLTFVPDRVYFATSDESDPNQNGRTYEIRYLRRAIPLGVHLGVVLLAAISVFVLLGSLTEQALRRRPRLHAVSRVVVSLVYGAALLQATFWVLVRDRLVSADTTTAALYRDLFDGAGTNRAVASPVIFAGHHYLDFVLNPAAVYMGERQFNARYRIRRKEPIRPKRAVRWRALALGGSTTFGERIAREEDTWVHRLERKIRDRYGDAYDVINGGVGGYNVVENTLHYLLLLEALEPDVVILYVGINDVHPRLIGDLEPDYSNSRLAWRPDENVLPTVTAALAPLYPYRYLTLLRLQHKTFAHIYDLVQRPYPPQRDWPAALTRNGPEIYRAHLEDLVRLLVAQRRSVVIVPAVFLPLADRPGDVAFARGVAEHNQVGERVARALQVSFLAAAADGTTFGSGDLLPFDNCHFNTHGHEKMAQLLFDALSAQDLIGDLTR